MARCRWHSLSERYPPLKRERLTGSRYAILGAVADRVGTDIDNKDFFRFSRPGTLYNGPLASNQSHRDLEHRWMMARRAKLGSPSAVLHETGRNASCVPADLCGCPRRRD